MFLLSGVARYLFLPLAEAVVFAMLASYFLSRTIVPTMAKYLLRHQKIGQHASSQPQSAGSDAAAIRSGIRKISPELSWGSEFLPASSKDFSHRLFRCLPGIAGHHNPVVGPGFFPNGGLLEASSCISAGRPVCA